MFEFLLFYEGELAGEEGDCVIFVSSNQISKGKVVLVEHDDPLDESVCFFEVTAQRLNYLGEFGPCEEQKHDVYL
jgi:hypothetical protein